MKLRNLAFLVAVAFLAHVPKTIGQGSFSYQGHLRDNGTSVNGDYTLSFKLYDGLTNGSQVGRTITNEVTITNGLFTVDLDFGVMAFNGGARWLDITVHGQALTPRHPITPAPYALYALASGTAGSEGTFTTGTLVATNLVLTAEDAPMGTMAGMGPTSGLSPTSAIGRWEITPSREGDDFLYFNYAGLRQMVLVAKGEGAPGVKGHLLADVMSAPRIIIAGIVPWIIDSGPVTVPTSGNTVSGALRFQSANGITRFGIDKDGNGAVVFGDFLAEYIRASGDVDVMGTLYANGDFHGNDADLDNIHATVDVVADGNMYAQSFFETSDRNQKENFAPIDGTDVLERVANLPISSWNFKTDADTRHIGPMAQDFYAAFNVGPDDKHISTIDAAGVALAAIQGLNGKLNERDAEIQRLKSQNESLEKRLMTLEAAVKLNASRQAGGRP